uniref:RING-type E3 ubiquitin transferase n=1 Tax=Percolomonas cosmopolitus TaxID=63605 RepID=A0A7S1KR24_9EUKA
MSSPHHHTRTIPLPIFPHAPQPDIIRATQKDTHYALYTYSLVRKCVEESMPGMVAWMRLGSAEMSRMGRYFLFWVRRTRRDDENDDAIGGEEQTRTQASNEMNQNHFAAASASSFLMRHEEEIMLFALTIYELSLTGLGAPSLGEEYCDIGEVLERRHYDNGRDGEIGGAMEQTMRNVEESYDVQTKGMVPPSRSMTQSLRNKRKGVNVQRRRGGKRDISKNVTETLSSPLHHTNTQTSARPQTRRRRRRLQSSLNSLTALPPPNTPFSFKRMLPVPLYKRQLQILLKYWVPYILVRLLSSRVIWDKFWKCWEWTRASWRRSKKGANDLSHDDSTIIQNSPPSPPLSRQRIKSVLQQFHRFHLAVFYLTGSYLTFSQRLFRIRYIFTGRPREDMFQFTYQLLGYIILMQQMFALYQLIKWLLRRQFASTALDAETRNLISSVQVEQDEVYSNDTDSMKNKCPLCLEPRRQTTSTSCGHLYCWECITDCFSTEETIKCPTCRSNIELRTLCRVYHYDGLLKV